MSEAPQRDMDGAPIGPPEAATDAAPEPEETSSALVPAKRKFVYTKDPDEKFPAKAPANPWERQPDETMRAYRAFEVYRSMDPEERSLKRMSEIIQTKTTPSGEKHEFHPYPWKRIIEWSRHKGWVARANAWDTEVARRSANKQLRDAEKMHERHINLSLMMQQKVSQRLADMPASELGRRDIDRWLDKAIRFERQARGMDRIGSDGNAPTKFGLGVNVNVNTQNGPQAPPPERDAVDSTPIGEYLKKHPGDVSEAVGNIQDLLTLVAASGESEDKVGQSERRERAEFGRELNQDPRPGES